MQAHDKPETMGSKCPTWVLCSIMCDFTWSYMVLMHLCGSCEMCIWNETWMQLGVTWGSGEVATKFPQTLLASEFISWPSCHSLLVFSLLGSSEELALSGLLFSSHFLLNWPPATHLNWPIPTHQPALPIICQLPTREGEPSASFQTAGHAASKASIMHSNIPSLSTHFHTQELTETHD